VIIETEDRGIIDLPRVVALSLGDLRTDPVSALVISSPPESGGVERVREALAGLVARWTAGSEVLETAISGLRLVRRVAPTEPISCLYEPSVVLVVQGRKQVMVGEFTYETGPHHFLLTSVDLPVLSGVVEASRESPYLALALKLDPRSIAEMIVDCNLPRTRGRQAERGMIVGEGTLPLFEAFYRQFSREYRRLFGAPPSRDIANLRQAATS
jgi:hypothetical protein